MKRMMFVLLFGFGLVFCGCSKTAENQTKVDGNLQPATVPQDGGHEVEGWCVEHELPEAECSLCNSKVAADFKKNGDWCNEHNRAESQCFLCDPTRKEKFVAKYEAQHGKKPPTSTTKN